jgi:hypothetical protein
MQKYFFPLMTLVMSVTLTVSSRADDPTPPVRMDRLNRATLLATRPPTDGVIIKKANALLPSKPSSAQIKAAFDSFDADKSGQLSDTEVYQVLTGTGVRLYQSQVRQLIKMFDVNNSGMWEFVEFERLLEEALKHRII